MRFRLVYDGRVNANANSHEKWRIRQCFQPQLLRLWSQPPLVDLRKYRDATYQPNDCYVGINRHGMTYVPIVSSALSLHAELDVLFLSSSRPGDLLQVGGDIDNRLKTLFDALTVPTENQEPPSQLNISSSEFDCALQDDKLVTRVSVENDQLLTSEPRSKQVLAIINVSVRLGSGTMANLGLGS